MVAWEAAPGCAPGTRSDVVITVTASDPDTDPADLTYSGNVGGCNGSLDAATSTVSCPNAATYPSTVMVSDPDGNDSTLVTFAVPICGTGDCTTDPNTCGS